MEDIDQVMNESGILPELNALAGHSVLITGATGLIGSSIADILFRYNETHALPIKVFIGGGRSQERAMQRFGKYYKKEYFQFLFYNALNAKHDFPAAVDFVLHGAGNAFPKMIVKEPVETMVSNFSSLYHLLNDARTYGVKRVLYLSSSEVYGIRSERIGNEPYCESEYGYIDLLQPRNLYSVGKRAAETLYISFGDEYGVDSVIVRPGHIYGPTASLQDNRVASAFAYAAARGEDIVMKSDGFQKRSYCYCLDCASAVIKVLLRGENGQAYNIANPDSVICIGDLAKLIANAGGVKLLVQEAEEEEKKGFNPMDNSLLDSEKLLHLGWKGCFNAETGISHMVSILKKMNGWD